MKKEYRDLMLKINDIFELMEQYENGEKSIEGFWDDEERPKKI